MFFENILEIYKNEIKAVNRYNNKVLFIDSVEVIKKKKEFLIKEIRDLYN